MERDIEARLGLARADRPDPPFRPDQPDRPDPLVTVIFRVSRGDFPVPQALAIVGTDPQLGNYAPNTVSMHDDGKEGDERAGDGVWSLAATFAPGTRLAYVYTNSGARGRWEGLDVPHIRSVIVPPSPGRRQACEGLRYERPPLIPRCARHSNSSLLDSSVAQPHDPRRPVVREIFVV